MKKLRVFLAAATLASAFTVLSASPAHATCFNPGEPLGVPNACHVVCAIGLGNKLTRPAFQWCYVT